MLSSATQLPVWVGLVWHTIYGCFADVDAQCPSASSWLSNWQLLIAVKSGLQADDVYNTLLQHLLPTREADARNVVLEVRVGVGGEWAGSFAMDLLHMYEGYCDRQNWQFEVRPPTAG